MQKKELETPVFFCFFLGRDGRDFKNLRLNLKDQARNLLETNQKHKPDDSWGRVISVAIDI